MHSALEHIALKRVGPALRRDRCSDAPLVGGPQSAQRPSEDRVPVRATHGSELPFLPRLRKKPFILFDDDLEAITAVAEVSPQLPLVVVDLLAQADLEAAGEVGGEPMVVVDVLGVRHDGVPS